MGRFAPASPRLPVVGPTRHVRHQGVTSYSVALPALAPGAPLAWCCERCTRSLFQPHIVFVFPVPGPRGCSVTTDPASPLKARVFFNKAVASTVACAAGAATLVGGTSSVVNLSVTLDVARSAATITVAGPSTVWFGVGFGATTMADQPWTVIVDGNTGEVSERKLGGPGATSHQPGTLLAPSVKVVSNAVSQGVRTVVLSRAFTGAGPAYFNFNASAADPTIPFISAVGSGPVLAYHANKAPSMLTLLPAGCGLVLAAPFASSSSSSSFSSASSSSFAAGS